MADLIIPPLPDGYYLQIEFSLDGDLEISAFRQTVYTESDYVRLDDERIAQIYTEPNHVQFAVDKLAGKINKGVEYVGTYRKVE